jgi:vancomycin resistance protein YoaR
MAESPRTRAPNPRARVVRRRRLALAGLVAVLAAVGVGIGLATTGHDGTAPAAVRLDGRDVSGLDPKEVARAARDRASELMRRPLVITRSDDPAFRIEASRASLGARPQIQRAVDEALEPRGFGGRLAAVVGLAPARDIPLRFTLDPRKVSDLVARVQRPLDRAPRPASLKVGADDITVVPGAGGFGVDAEDLRARILRLPERIDLTPAPLPPPVSEAAAADARARALALVSHPVSVTLQGRGVEIEPSVLRAALRITPAPPDLRIGLDPDTLYADIASAFGTREQPARDAGFRISGSSVALIPSRIGRSLDMPAIVAAILASPTATSVRARFTVTRPERTTRQARALRITELVSEYTTPYNCCEPRVTNIQRAAEILDGTIIPAGGRFSLNEALGERTLARGFVTAPQIAGGRLEDAVGGGVSQVSTTMYNAAFFAGLQLVAHTPHQFWISRYPKGREATLSYGGPEMIFVNDWPAAILVSVSAGSNGVTVRFFSSKLGRRVETETGEPTDPVVSKVRETVDPTLKPGERVVEQEQGGDGFTISYTRKVYEGDRLRRDETYTWKYDPEDAFIKVGPPKKPERATTAPDPSGTPGSTAPGDPAAPATTPTGTSTGAGTAAPPP